MNWIAILLAFFCLTGAGKKPLPPTAQSLGETARKEKEQKQKGPAKKSTKVLTNEDIPAGPQESQEFAELKLRMTPPVGWRRLPPDQMAADYVVFLCPGVTKFGDFCHIQVSPGEKYPNASGDLEDLLARMLKRYGDRPGVTVMGAAQRTDIGGIIVLQAEELSERPDGPSLERRVLFPVPSKKTFYFVRLYVPQRMAAAYSTVFRNLIQSIEVVP
jgi:hypothetical protein